MEGNAERSEKIEKAISLFEKGQHEDALRQLEAVLEERIALSSANHGSIAEVQCAIAFVLVELGKYDEAMNYAIKGYKECVLAFGFFGKFTLLALRRIGFILLKQGQSDASLNIYQEVYHHQLKHHGPRHYETLETLNRMGFVLQKKGEDVLPIYEKMYNMLKDDCPNEVFTLVVRCNMAAEIANRGQFDEALKILKEVTAVYDRNETRNQQSLNCLDLTAKVLVKQGKHADALGIWEDVLQKQVQFFGSEDPKTLETLKTLRSTITCVSSQKRFKERLEFLKVVYNRRKNILGSNHPETLIAQVRFARILFEYGETDQTLLHLNEIHDVLNSSYPNSPKILAVKKSLEVVLVERCEYDKAMSLCKDIANIQKNLHPDHPDVLSTQILIANLLINQEKYDDASEMLDKISKIHKDSSTFQQVLVGTGFPQVHQQVLAVQALVAVILEKQGKVNEALKMFSELLDFVEKSKNQLKICPLLHVGLIYDSQGKFKESQGAFEQLYAIYVRSKGDDHPYALSLQSAIAYLLAQQGEFDKSCKIYTEVHAKRCSTLGCCHSDTESSQRSVDRVLLSAMKDWL